MANELEWIDTVEKRGDARLVGQDVWINQRTGEIIEAQTLTKEVKGDVDVGFEKLWVGHILEAVDEVGNAKMKVLFWLIRNKDRGNMVRATLDDIAAKTGSSRSTVARLMASLRKANVVRLEHGGRWMLNPAVVFKGAQPPNECADSLSSDGTTRASLGARRERAEGCLMPIIEMVLPGEPKQQPEHVAEVYRITVERGDGIACSDMEAKTAMSLLCIEMVTNGLKKSRPKRSKKTSKEVE